MAIFQDNPNKLLQECYHYRFIGAKMMEVVVTSDSWSYKTCKAPLKSSPPTNQHPTFYMPDAIPVAQPTVSEHWREKYHITQTCSLQAYLGVFQSHFLPLSSTYRLITFELEMSTVLCSCKEYCPFYLPVAPHIARSTIVVYLYQILGRHLYTVSFY